MLRNPWNNWKQTETWSRRQISYTYIMTSKFAYRRQISYTYIMTSKFDYRSDLAPVAPPFDCTDGVRADETRGIANKFTIFFSDKLAAMQQGFIPHEMEGWR